MESEPGANMSDSGLYTSQPHCNEGADKQQEDLGVDVSSVQHSHENTSNSAGVSQKPDCPYYVTWTVCIALAVPRGDAPTHYSI